VLVADLRLDNREELAGALGIESDRLALMADREILLAAYRQWGAHCAEKLVGDFVFVVWDTRSNTLTMARDHMGQRHLYYHRGDGFFAFATEIKGLWSLPDIPRRMRDEAAGVGLRQVFVKRPDPGQTSYEGIRGLTAATILTLDAEGRIATRRYWDASADPAHENRDEAYYVATYRKVLGEAVACRIRRNIAPAGLFMGGGFDTSGICGLAGLAGTKHKFVAASSVMPEDYKGTIHHARKWVEMCRRVMPHLDVRYVTREGLDVLQGMEKSFAATDNGHSPNRFVNDALYQAIAGAGCRVAMDGFGGDYTVNPRAQNALARLLVRGKLRRFLLEFAATRRFRGQSFLGALKNNVLTHFIPPAIQNIRMRRKQGLPLFGETMPIARAQQAGKGAKRTSPLASQRKHMRETLRHMQDGHSIAGSVAAAVHGLQFTQPFHDKRVVEFGLAIPEDLHFRNGRERHLARVALADLYPPEFQTRLPGNDDSGPDFLSMAKRIEPQVLAEIDRMDKAGRLSAYFDFPRMRRMLTRRRADQHNSGNEFDTRQAMLAFLQARYIEWFSGANR
jgi:asparagine synthase (glutamine-hydrolysing)